MFTLEKFVDPDKINWCFLLSNKSPYVMDIVRTNLHKIDKSCLLSLSSNENAIEILKQYPEYIDWDGLSSNSNAIDLLEQCPERINWDYLSLNPNAIHLLEKNLKKVCWRNLSSNHNAIDILKRYPDNIEWYNFLRNPNIIEYDYTNSCYKLLDFINPNKIIWSQLCHNPNPNVISILEANLDKVNSSRENCWCSISENPNAIKLLEKYPEKIAWNWLSRNYNAIHLLEANIEKVNWLVLSCNQNAIHLLESNIEKVNWENLSRNPNAIDILKNNIDNIHWRSLSFNTNIFTYNYTKMRLDKKDINLELIEKFFNPHRILKLYDKECKSDDIDFDFNVYLERYY